MTSGTLPVAGAGLFYKLTGTGPLLLILQGGAGDADASDGLAAHLADRYTVLSYDRRGQSRSPIEDPDAPLTLHTHSDDVHHLLESLASEPVFVLGVSIGALIALDLVCRYPEQVRLAVAHEPPTPAVLPADQQPAFRRIQESFEEVFATRGIRAALRLFSTALGLDLADREPDIAVPPPTPQRTANLTFFLARDAPAVRLYQPDLDALRAQRSRIVPAFAELKAPSAPGRLPHDAPARALAALLGKEAVGFPGGHGGYATHPRAFAVRLREVLETA